MGGKKFGNPFSFMPAGLIHPEINQHPPVTKKNSLDHCEKSISIAFFLTYHPMSARKGIDPSKNIQPFVMLTLRQDHRLISFLHPDPPQFGMKTKPGFIRKKEDSFSLTSLGRQEFFLLSSEIPPPLPWWLEHSGKSVAAKKILTGASIAELGAPSIEPRDSVQDIRRRPLRPNGYASNPMSGGSFLTPSPKLSVSLGQHGTGAPAVSLALPPRLPFHLSFGSISPRSSELDQKGGQPVRNSSLRTEEAMQQSGSQSRLPVSSLPALRELCASRCRALLSMLSWYPSRKKVCTIFRKVLYTHTF